MHPLPRQHAAAIGCYQPIGVLTLQVHSHCVESFEGLTMGVTVNSHCVGALKVSYSDVGEGGVAVNCEKNTIFPEHPVLTSCGER